MTLNWSALRGADAASFARTAARAPVVPGADGQNPGFLTSVVDDVARRAGRRQLLALGLLTPLFAILALTVAVYGA